MAEMLNLRLVTLRTRIMPDGLLYLLIFVAAVVIYTIGRVVQLQRQSKEQWEKVDKSKLKEWDDEEDD